MRAEGRCECGAVSFSVPAVRETVTFCHCGQCRRMSGHFWAATEAPFADLEFKTESGLRWYASSDWAKRGFCGECGSSLFYRENDSASVSIAAGCLQTPTGMRPGRHIFTADKGDYYDIADDAPHFAQY